MRAGLHACVCACLCENYVATVVTSIYAFALPYSDVCSEGFIYLSISDKGHKATNMPLNNTVHKHNTIKTKVDMCIIKIQDYRPSYHIVSDFSVNYGTY